jgi:biotin carboxylase
MKIEKILVANRGEIALRAIRTIKEMGKQAIAVYSTADKDALYLQHADASICIGGAKSSESYLSIPAIISAAEISGCDAIFPGYGFLSENQTFVEVCKHHNIKFIGPSVDSMVLMSDKSKAKEVMKKRLKPPTEKRLAYITLMSVNILTPKTSSKKLLRLMRCYTSLRKGLSTTNCVRLVAKNNSIDNTNHYDEK